MDGYYKIKNYDKRIQNSLLELLDRQDEQIIQLINCVEKLTKI